uniref:Uncharacterized protein n=1 Tax=Onchocerca volvulus TaxID=6282 RepID=A0A8R1TQ17_ONCVO
MQLREFHANHDINKNNEQEMTEKTNVKLRMKSRMENLLAKLKAYKNYSDV